MSRHLAITWTSRMLRYVHVESDRRGDLTLLDAGRQDIVGDGDLASLTAGAVEQLITRLKADKSRLIVLMNRGAVDSATFDVPPASESELPLIVQNLATREIPGTTDQSPVDFIAYPQKPDGSRTVSAMALIADDQAVLRRVLERVSSRSPKVLVSTHPLRVFVPELMKRNEADESSDAATLVISRGDDAADLLLCRANLPLLSRSIRLPAEFPSEDIHRYLCAETQRTLIAASGQLREPARVSQIVVVGGEEQIYGLDGKLSSQFDAVAAAVRPVSILANEATEERSLVVDSGDFAPLLAAVYEDAHHVTPAVDFANPRRPPEKASHRKLLATVAVTIAGLIGAGWYYVSSQFSEIDQENDRLVTRLNELNELIRETESRRQLARFVDAWDKNRISWPDELRDLTERIPASPEINIQQLTISSAGPGTAVASFRGVSKQPESIARMESSLRDKYHDIRIPGVREQQEGDKVTSAFQATLTIRKRPVALYSQSISKSAAEKPASGKDLNPRGSNDGVKPAESRQTAEPESKQTGPAEASR